MKGLHLVVLFLALFLFWLECASHDGDNLVLVHVLFRHGNRTPNGPDELYINDPYYYEDYWPYGLGQLKNAGKKREFHVGQSLRKRYDKFLGPYYYPQIVDAVSTDYNRTKMSLELVLAGLFPPVGMEIWNKWLGWQPIPYNYLPSKKDKVLLGTVCPHFKKVLSEYLQSDKAQKQLKKDKELFEYVSKETGVNVTTYLHIYNLYFGLTTEKEWGFELPEWTKKVYPKPFTELTIQQYFYDTATTELRQMASGYFLQKVIKDTYTHIKQNTPGRKIYLYSAHENNVAELLIVLGVFEPPHIPNYGAHVMLEIHEIYNQYYIKIFYDNEDGHEPKELKIPGCYELCEIGQFASLVKEYMPEKDLCFQ